MSEVISFRLDRSNPREAKALSILQQKRGEGLSIREIVTQALIILDGNPNQLPSIEPVVLAETIRKINQLLDRDYERYYTQKTTHPGNSNLREEFIISVQNAAKPGLGVSESTE